MTTNSPVVAYRRKRLKQWIDDHFNGVQQEFIAATGINQGELSGLLRTKSFGEKRARRLEEQANMPMGYLDQLPSVDRVAEAISEYEATLRHPLSNRRQMVRVQGMVAMDKHGFWQPGDVEGELWEVNTDDPNAYAIRVLTQHFQSVAAPGQCLLVSPHQDLKPGRWVLVTLVDGRRTFRTFHSHEYGIWHFSAVNDPAVYLDLPDDNVSAVERVMSVSWTD